MSFTTEARERQDITSIAVPRLSLKPTINRKSVSSTVLARHSTRAFCSKRQVPISVVEDSLRLAQHSPSSTNLQPWRLTLVSGAALRRLSSALTSAFRSGAELQLPAIPAPYQHYRTTLGQHVYGPEGYNIPRGDTAAHMEAVARNFNFYNAPLIGVVTVDAELSDADVLSVGAWLQTLMLLLTEQGLGTQVSVSTVGYSDIIRQELGISGDMKILCTIGIGYEDEGEGINRLKMPRDEWRDSVRYVTE